MSYRQAVIKHWAKRALMQRGKAMTPQLALNRALHADSLAIQHNLHAHAQQLYLELASHHAQITELQQCLTPDSTGGMRLPSPVRNLH